ncbi:MAG: glycogen-binding domain-containing protein, partial [Candidatus Omnitrophica bacterium]|nr:glycogen-binding domain-containing protein [Candidatus Omnitrophota bacterium]
KIRSSVRLRESASLGKTIFEHDPKCSSSLDFYNLTSEILAAESRDIKIVIKEFSFYAPKAGSVYVLGDFNGWEKSEANRLAKLESGDWAAHFTLDKGRYRYKFLVDDEWTKDPHNDVAESNVFGTTDSVIEI